MPRSSLSISSSVEFDHSNSARYVHSISEAGRLLPSDSRWNSIELNFNTIPQSPAAHQSIPSLYSMSVDYNLVITDKAHFKRFLYITISLILVVLALVLMVMFLPHKHRHHSSSKNLTLAVHRALTFFDAQKSGSYPKSSPVNFRGDSGMRDGDSSDVHADLLGGFYDSGNNIKFSFTTAYTVTLLSWSVIEYHHKFDDLGELEHVKDIIRWGTDYLLKLFIASNTTSDPILYSQVGGTDDDLSCWQRPEDMSYPRPVSHCDITASDLAGEIIAGLSAASLVFKDDTEYNIQLVGTAESLFDLATSRNPQGLGTYTSVDECGGQARQFYNSTSFKDELAWAGTWLFFATGNASYLAYATSNFSSVLDEQPETDAGVYYWNNKVLSTTILLTRLLYFRDLGYPYEEVLTSSSTMVESVMCKYVSVEYFDKTPGGLILLKPDAGSPLELAATASFLSKLYKDYLDLLPKAGGRCGHGTFSLKMLQSFSLSQINYILGNNPMKMSYVVGFGEQYPTQVHHRSASIAWDDRAYSCNEGQRWLHSTLPNPNILLGAMVKGPDPDDIFVDNRGKPWFTEPSIASNAGLVAALIALHDPPRHSIDIGLDQTGIFYKIRPIS